MDTQTAQSTHATRPQTLEFHRLASIRPRTSWWVTPIAGCVSIALYVALMLTLMVTMIIIAIEVPALNAVLSPIFTVEHDSFNLDQPALTLALLIPLVLLIPPTFWGSRIVQGRGTGYLLSVTGRLRWSWFVRTLGLAFALFAAYFAIALAIGWFTGERLAFDASHPGIPLMIAITLVCVPLQAAAEELVFRGYLMQLIGTWLRQPAFAILLPVPLFVFGHGYDVWGSLDVAVFAVVAGWLSWRTGGLEAAMSMHIANNVLLFAMAAFSLVDANATESTPTALIGATIVMLSYAVVIDRWVRCDAVAGAA